MLSDADGSFSREVLRLRAEYQNRRQASNLCPPAGQPVLDMELTHGTPPTTSIWYEDGSTPLGRYVRLFDIPGTLSGDILRLNRNFPSSSSLPPSHFEIEGDIIRPLGGSCDPTARCSPHVIHLLGASVTGDLVFDKLATRGLTLARASSLGMYKRWLLGLLDALAVLHAAGIVHRDLRVDNLLFARDGSEEGGEESEKETRLVVCDLEGRWGQRVAPEVKWEVGLEDSGWSEKSDVYDVGGCIKGMVYANAPLTPQVEWPVPEPLDRVVEACMREVPGERPTVGELREMVEGIKVD
ncbi:hypothetical protein B0J18DRAFT_477397 [Chaetomium sp. MPI-SDFR-AT-0129]|nr:hypothetical protein B0J18DRAFT_477397 [Chaetomium sp. MPI-SDFR-AT-0129]